MQKVENYYRAVIFTALLIISLWVLWRALDIVLLFFISVVIMSALSPVVAKLEQWKIPRGLSVIAIYLVLWTFVGTVVASTVPSLIDQTTKLIRALPAAVNKIEFLSSHQQEISAELLGRIGTLPADVLKITVGLFGNLLSILTCLVVSYYLLIYEKQINNLFSGKAARVVSESQRRLGAWVRGELMLMLAVGLFTYFGLLILNIDIALPLALLAGILEIIPNIGPTVAAVPAIIVAFSIHPLVALATTALYFLTQMLENNILVPKIMQKVVGINPLVSILVLMLGFKLAGASGAALAIPILIVVRSILSEFPLSTLLKV